MLFAYIENKLNSYGKDDKALLDEIRKRYKANINPESEHIPDQFKMRKENSDRPVYQINETALEGYNSQPQMGSGHLRAIADDLLAHINLYQKMRYNTFSSQIKEFFGYDSLKDPETLFCEELKLWLILSLSHSSLDDELLEVVQRRIKYIDRCTTLFISKGGDIDGKSMHSVMSVISARLQEDVVPQIQLAISRQSAREHFDELIRYSRNAILHGMKFIFYVFREGSDINEFCLSELRVATTRSYEQGVDNYSARMLQHLLQTELFYTLFPNSFHSRQLIEKSSNAITETNMWIQRNPFMNKSWHRNLQTYYPDLLGDHSSIFPQDNWFAHNRSGILPAFRNKEMMQAFVEFHGLLYHLAIFHLICKEIHTLAGDAGNIFVYGVIANYLNKLMISFDQIKSKFIDCLETISRKALDQSHNNSNKKRYVAWKRNYLEGKVYGGYFNESLSKCNTRVARVREQISQDVYLRFKDIVLKANNLVASLESYCRFTQAQFDTNATDMTCTSTAHAASMFFNTQARVRQIEATATIDSNALLRNEDRACCYAYKLLEKQDYPQALVKLIEYYFLTDIKTSKFIYHLAHSFMCQGDYQAAVGYIANYLQSDKPIYIDEFPRERLIKLKVMNSIESKNFTEADADLQILESEYVGEDVELLRGHLTSAIEASRPEQVSKVTP